MNKSNDEHTGATRSDAKSWLTWIVVLGFVVYVVFKFSNLNHPSTRVYQLDQARVIMYATNTCPYCAEARYYFAKHKIPYFEYNIDQSVEARRQFVERSGFATPLIYVGSQRMDGFSPKRIKKMLAQ